MYFIYDCNNSIVGNPNGYRTFRGANNQASGKSTVNNLIWSRFYDRKNKADNMISSIKLKAVKQ